MGLIERVQLLHACPGLGSLGLDILADLGLEGELLQLRSGQAWQPQTGSYAALLAGELKLHSSGKARAPSLVGWLDALAEATNRPRWVAAELSTLMVFDIERLWDRLEDHPEQGVELVRSLSRLLA